MQTSQIRKSKDILKDRVKIAKKLLPRDWMKRLIVLAPEYDSVKGYLLMTNVHKQMTSHVHVTELIELVAKEYQAEIAKATSDATTAKQN